ncbi:hypothetical protein Bbelb_227320 [Branchiostoma belcheri]|nr:hypothetical protein Bbelb_227320 [Branchiostoma belcheri]
MEGPPELASEGGDHGSLVIAFCDCGKRSLSLPHAPASALAFVTSLSPPVSKTHATLPVKAELLEENTARLEPGQKLNEFFNPHHHVVLAHRKDARHKPETTLEKVSRSNLLSVAKTPSTANRPSRPHITRVAQRKNNADTQQDCEGG